MIFAVTHLSFTGSSCKMKPLYFNPKLSAAGRLRRKESTYYEYIFQ
ncbi:hypothetical protein BRYFOR_09374 [Marvinbryantia formatexigens DSM 14469]|uniref:Uncharacterized protein n=1 Tax=Marvinbryantia formatexigens DSM 14469 TaxID=478749 RepID=C6LL26_9FIRM|nr:hypothetical protein BRYFOR_09374 [Marvinbryantia formatexigens DSM 14469]